MKNLKFILFFLLSNLITFKIFSQSFYQISWQSNSVSYKAFYIYYSDDNSIIRVKYTSKDNSDKIVQYQCKSLRKMDNTQTAYCIVGLSNSIKYITSLSRSQDITQTKYNVDNFIFYNVKDGVYSEMYQYDKNDEVSLDTNPMNRAICQKLDPINFSEEYLSQFFLRSEPLYQELLTLSSKPILQTESATLHLVIVANTYDGSIGKSCIADENHIQAAFKEISQSLGIQLNIVVIDGSSFSKEILLQQLQNLEPQKNDIVVFVYSGHGFRYDDQISNWPQISISIRTSPYDPLIALSMNDIISTLHKKRARLNIILSDCCNNRIGRNQSLNFERNVLRSEFHPDIKKLRALFLKTSGMVISTACKPNEVAWGNGDLGGFFTNSFIESLYQEVSYSTLHPTWDNLIDNTLRKTEIKSRNCKECEPQSGIKSVNVSNE
jgi:hypothetical protein